MTIAHCPMCREQVLVPSGTSRQARVRCPLCSVEYRLDDVLSSLPPVLVVLHDPAVPTEEPALSREAAISPFPGSRPGGAESLNLEEPPEVESFELAPASSAPAFQFESSAPSYSASRPRARRKQGSPLRLIVQTIGGGAMGLVIAQLILWWLPGKWHASNRDPLGLAEKVAAYAPFIVPATLHGNAPAPPATQMETDMGSRPSLVDTATAPSEPGSSGAGTGAELDSSIPNFNFDANATTPANTAKNKLPKSKKGPKSEPVPEAEEFPLAGLDKNKPTPSTVEANAPDPIAIPDLSLDAAPSQGDGKMKKSGLPSEPNDAAAAKVAPASTEPIGLRDPPAIDAEQLSARIEGVAFADRAWNTAQNPSREEMQDLIIDLHDKLAQLGDAAAILGSTQPKVGAPLLPVTEQLQSLVQNQQTVTYLGQLSGRRIEEIQDAGAVAVGVVESHTARGKVHEVRIQLKSRPGSALDVVGAVDLAETLPVGASVLILGRMVADPVKNLNGYDGNANKVLLHGAHVVIAGP